MIRGTPIGKLLVLVTLGALIASAWPGASSSSRSRAASRLRQDIVWSRRIYQARGHSYYQIWRMHTDGSSAHQITRGPRDHCSPAVSWDGRAIAYLSGEAGHELWIARADGTRARKLPASDVSAAYRLVWAPDGHCIRATDLWDDETIEVEVASGRTQRIRANVSRNGRWEAIVAGSTRGGRVLLLDRTSKARRTVLEGWVVGVSWSPQADSLAAVVGEGRPKPEEERMVLHLLEAASGNDLRVEWLAGRRETLNTGTPLWSPDGRFIAIEGNAGQARGDLWVYDLNRREWLHPGDGTQPSWSATGDLLLYRTNEDIGTYFGMDLWLSHIIVFDAMTRTRTQVTHGGSANRDPSWVPAVSVRPSKGRPADG